MHDTADRELCRIKVAHLYPTVMDAHGDSRNIDALRARGERRGIAVDVEEIGVGDPVSLSDVDLVFIGGGQETGQTHVAADLAARGPALRDLVEQGAAVLAVGGGFQLFGNVHVTASGREIPGIGVFDASSSAGLERHTGDLRVEAVLDGPTAPAPVVLSGYQDRQGVTELGACARPLGTVVEGEGGQPAHEGAVYGQAVGTYLHGPVLADNPALADHLLRAAVRHRYRGGALVDGALDSSSTDADPGRKLAG